MARVGTAPVEVGGDLREAAEEVGLVYVDDGRPGLTRRRSGKGFRYLDAKGTPVRDAGTLARVRALAIPPAYTDVWICPRRNGHIQATGRDAKGRKQYRYHPDFRQARETDKFARIMGFADVLPALRRRIEADMRRHGLPREKVLATIVHLLETTLIRVGNDDYARTNRSYGLTTLRDPHVTVAGPELRFRFAGKSGKVWNIALKDRRVARIVKACQDLPGQELFQYLDADGARRDVTSSDVNAYLREVTGQDYTAKDFRTWAGTVLAAMALHAVAAFDSEAVAKRHLRAAIEGVAQRLGNTPTICRRCYIHPQILDCYLAGELILQIKDAVESELTEDPGRLRSEEAAVLGLLQKRLACADAVQDGGRLKTGSRGGAAAKRTAEVKESSGKRTSGAEGPGRGRPSRARAEAHAA